LNKKYLFALIISLFVLSIIGDPFSIGEGIKDNQVMFASFYDEEANNSKPNLSIQVIRGWILVIKNVGDTEITNITFSFEKVNGKLPNTISFDIVENITTWKGGGMEIKVGKHIEKIARLDVNESIALIDSQNEMGFINASEVYKYANSGWLIIQCDQGIEKRVPYTFTPHHGFSTSIRDLIWNLIYVFLYYILPLLIVVAIIVLIGRKKKNR